MKNVDKGDSNIIPPTSTTHSNNLITTTNPPAEDNQETIKSKNDSKITNLGDDKETQSSKLTTNKSSISHPKVIDILDNQLEQLADQLNKCQKATNSPLCSRKDLLKYSKQVDSKANITSEASTGNIKQTIKPQQTNFKPENVSKHNAQKCQPSEKETTIKTHEVLTDGIKPENPDKIKPSKFVENMETNENSSSRKTSSSSNGSNSTTDSSSSFSSHPLKTLPEHPDLSSNTKTSNLIKKDNSVDNNKSLLWQDDPGQLLNAWLGELDSLQKDLNSLDSTDGNTSSSFSTPYQPNHLNGNFRGPTPAGSFYSGPSNSSRESSLTPVHMRRMSTPRVDSPRLDSYRYSLINLEETLDQDLDAILGELNALENNFGDGDPDISRDSDTSSKASKASSTISSSSTVVQVVRPSTTSNPPNSSSCSTIPENRNIISPKSPKTSIPGTSNGQTAISAYAPMSKTKASPEYLKMTSKIDSVIENKAKNIPSEPEYITAEFVRQKKMANAASHSSQQGNLTNNNNATPNKRTDSPDNDSAFCDNISSNSGNGSNGCTESSSSKLGNHAGILRKENKAVEPTPSLASNNEYETLKPTSAAIEKAEKIRLAIEKIKEASIKKIFIKVFGEDGSAKSLLVDERMTVSQVCRMLADKNHVKRDTCWGLVELLPELHMERAYEDHELLVENLLMWKADSKNTLWFIKRPEVFDLFARPEMYLLGETSSQIGHELDDRARAELVEEYFSSTGVGAPEVEGTLWLKAESKKSWKRFHFVLRTSGLYYAPKAPVASGTSIGSKGNKRASIGHRSSTKGLVCLARFDGCNQVYYGVKWQAKFKAPTRHCFAVKHPQIQAKNPKYIRYLAAETEGELNKWVTGIRVAKYGKTLYENYRGIIEQMAHDDIDQIAASSRLSVHDPKSTNAIGNPNMTDNPHTRMSHAVQNETIINSIHQKKGSSRPIILADQNKSNGNFGTSQASYHQQKQNEFDRIVADNVDRNSCEESASVLTPNSNENCSFDSALQMSDDFYSTSSQGWKNDQENISTLKEPNDYKNNSHTLKSIASVSQASVSSGSTSDKNTEHGFNCDSPEGGTIRKQPKNQAIPSALKSSSTASRIASTTNGNQSETIAQQTRSKIESSPNIKSTDGILHNNAAPKQVKGVRFKESFIAIPRPPSDVYMDDDYDNNYNGTITRLPLIDNDKSEIWNDKSTQKPINNNRVSDVLDSKQKAIIGANNRYAPSSEILDQLRVRKNSNTPLQRRYSNESLVSNNSVMMHTGTLIQANAIDDLALNQQSTYPNKPLVHNVSVPLQPDRPAPVLKPAVGRKPSLDRSSILQMRKQQSLAGHKLPPSDVVASSPKPTYEDTLKKCQSLTRHHSSPPSPNPSMNGSRDLAMEKQNVSRQSSLPTTSISTPSSPGMKYTARDNNLVGASPILNKRLPSPPKSPAVPPKPDIASLRLGHASRQLKDDLNAKKYDAGSRLPPSGNNSMTQPKTGHSLLSQSSPSKAYSPLPQNNENIKNDAIPPLNNRQHQLNQAFLNDLHLAMSAKLVSQDTPKNVVGDGLQPSIENRHNHQKTVNASVNNWLMNQTSLNNARIQPNTIECESPPFPVNRFSNGEYDNIQSTESVPSKSVGEAIKSNQLIRPSGVAKAVKSLPNKTNGNGVQVASGRPPIVSNNQRVKKMAPPPPPLANRTKENEASYSNWKRS